MVKGTPQDNDRELNFTPPAGSLSLSALDEVSFRMLIEGVMDYSIFMLDPTGHIVTWNRGAQRTKGYAPDEIIGRHFSVFYTPEDLAIRKPWRALETAVREGRFEDESWRVRKDGTRFWANVLITPIYDEEHRLRGFTKVTRDLTERRRAEEELRESEELFRRTFEDAPIGMSMVGVDYRFIRVNNALASLLGYTPDELTRLTFVDITHPDDVETDVTLADQLFKGEIHTYKLEKRYITKPGDVIWIDLTVSMVRDRDGNPMYVLGMVEDITERKQLAEERARINEELERRVVERTAQLSATNAELEREIAEREIVERENSRLLAQVDQQRQRLDNIISNVPGLVWEAWGKPDASDQRIDFISDYVEQMLGYTVEEWLGTPNFWLTIVHPDDRETAIEVANSAYRSGQPHTNQFRWVAKDGRVVWVESHSVTVHDDSGQAIGMRGVTMDITTRKRLEQQVLDQAENMRREYERLANLVANVKVGLTMVDVEGRYQLVNDEWLRQVGLTREEVLGRTVRELGDGLDIDWASAEKVLAKGEPAYFPEYHVSNEHHPEGRYFDTSVVPLRDVEGNVTGLLTAVVDVTEQVRIRKEVEEQRAVLATVLETAPVGIAMFDADMRVVSYNSEWARLSGVGAQDIRGKVFYEVVPYVRDRVPLYARVLDGETIDSMNVAYVPSGSDKPEYRDVHMRPMRDSDGKVTGMLSAVVDATTRHEIDQAKDQFIALASHELKTPVTTIKGYAQSTLRNLDKYDGERLARTLNIINEQSNRITRLINEMLDISRMQNETITLTRETFDLRELVAEVVNNQALVSPDFSFHVNLPDQPALVNADHQRVEQVITNLAQNALKYSGESHRIEVAVTLNKGEVVACVRDYGLGIPAQQQALVFQRFFRASNVASSNYSGLGLGLFISNNIIQRHGGRMWLQSKEGQGSTFYFALPRADK